MINLLSLRRVAALVLIALCAPVVGGVSTLNAQSAGRFLGKEDIILFGVGLKVEPARQVVPKDIATIVATFLQAPTLPDGLPPFAPDAEVRATLRGPSFATPKELVVAPNTPFHIPPLSVPGIHTLENIRLISNGEVLLRGVPENTVIEVIEKLLVTQVTARALSAAEIRERGIVFDKTSFQAYNFSAAFAIEDRPVTITFPVVLPTLQGATDVAVTQTSIPAIAVPVLPNLQTIIPDTLKLQTQIPNLQVVGFTLNVPEVKGQNLFVPPIPGVIVIPGDIGFLNQFFSVMLMVSNVAPPGSNLVVSELTAEIVLPPGNDTVVGSADDPLRMARTSVGETPRIRVVLQAGLDGKLGTADDIRTVGPGETGNAEYLVEGLREGSHVVEMEMSGTLLGLPIGPVTVRGRAAGAVLVRNPNFTLTFTHPEVVTAGEPYTLDVTVTNTSLSPANFVSLNLYPRNVNGASIVGEPTREIESIAPGDSSTVSFDLISRITGKVTAATLDSDEKVAGRFGLKTAVGELGVPLSPDSLVLPKEASALCPPEPGSLSPAACLPKTLRDAALGLLGKAWAVATAPSAALPKDVRRFSKKIVIDRAVEVAEAGLRRRLHEPLRDTATQLAMDFIGSNFTRLDALNPKPGEADFARDDFTAFDELRRHSVRGDVFAEAVASLFGGDFASLGPAAFHNDLARKVSYRPSYLSVLLGTNGGPAPFALSVIDGQGRRVGGTGAKGKVVKEIPFSDHLSFKNVNGAIAGEMVMLTVPGTGNLTVRLEKVAGVADDAPFTLSLVVPDAAGGLRQIVYQGISGQVVPTLTPTAGDPLNITFELLFGEAEGTGAAVAPTSVEPLPDPAPTVLGIVQQAEADILRCEEESVGFKIGRVVGILFSEEVTAASVQDRIAAEAISHFNVDGNRVVGVALQPGRRIIFVALRDPVGPFVPRQVAISEVADLRGQLMAPVSQAIEMTLGDAAGVVSGRVIQADGTPVPFANVRLFYSVCANSVGISSKSADAQGHYSWDYVSNEVLDRIVAVDNESEEFRDVSFNIQRNGQRLNIDIVLLGRGTFQGRALAENGTPLRNTVIRVTSFTDQSQYGATTDDQGRFAIARIPVGNIFVEAVNTTANAKTTLSEFIPFAGATTIRDITLLDVELRKITVKQGLLTGRVLRADGSTPVANVPVIVYYESNSQPGVTCNGECPIALVNSNADGSFTFENLTAGRLLVKTFDQEALQEGAASVVLAPGGAADVTVLVAGGLGTVRGIVLDPEGHPVSGARVGGGLTLTTTNQNGEFVLTDVPVGRRTIVAVSDELGSSAQVSVDIVRAGEEVGATIVLDALASVAGVVYQNDGVTPAASTKVYLFEHIGDGKINIVGTAVTDAQGRYRIDKVRLGRYTVSAFKSDFTDGNVAPAALKFNNQTLKVNVTFRGGGGRVFGVALDDDGQTPLKARVGISGDQVVVAGGQVGVGFQNVQNFKIVDTDFTTGRFSMSGLFVGPFTLRAVGQFSPDPVTLEGSVPSPGAAVEMNIRLQATSQIRGTVFLPNGVTPVGANVLVKYQSNGFRVICVEDPILGDDGEPECDSIPQGIQNETVVTDAQGRFWLPIVNAGEFTLTAEDQAGGRFGIANGTVRAGEVGEIPVRLLGTGELTVHVIASDGTTPIPGAKIVVTQLAFPKKELTSFADTQGALVFVGGDAFTEGELVVMATDVRTGFTGRASGKIVTDGDQVTVRVFLFNAWGTVFGTVFRSDGLTPEPNAEVVISNGAGPLVFAVTDSLGTYRITQVPLGDFTVDVFSAANARRGFRVGHIALDRQEVPANVIEAAIGLVKGGVFQGGSLAPLKGWRVALSQTSPSGRSLPMLHGTTSVDGGFSFPGASQGTFHLSAGKDGVNGSASAAGAIVREGQVVDVPLVVNILRPLFGNVEGTAFNPDGSPASNAQVSICFPNQLVCPSVSLTAAADGTFALPGVPLGRFGVTAKSQTTRDAGAAIGQLDFDGDTTTVNVVLVGLRQVSGTVFLGNGQPAANVEVQLEGNPQSGCEVPGEGDVVLPQSCTTFANASGTFSFVDVPAKTFTVTARDPVSNLKGAVGGVLNPGEHKVVRVVLEPSGAVTARVLFANGTPAAGITADLTIHEHTADERHLFKVTAADGSLRFGVVPTGPFTVSFEDPIGEGIARRTGVVSSDVPLGDVVLDESAPMVAGTTPRAPAVSVPLNQVFQMTFSEPIDPGTINPSNVAFTGPLGAVSGILNVSAGDTLVTFAPVSPLKDETRYSLRVNGVTDRIGKVMRADFVTSFTTVDITRPVAVDISPAANTNGVSIESTVRIKYSEPFDPLKFRGPPLTLTVGGVAVEGQLEYILGNTVSVFTPKRPLNENTTYRVQAGNAVDLAGNEQAQALDFTFATTDRTPPVILGLSAANNGTVIEGGFGSVTADLGGSHDIAVVDFFINNVFAFADRTAPFELRFQASPPFKAGDTITVSAVAIDTSGNRGVAPVSTSLTVLPDQAPTVAITSPAAAISAPNGAHIAVTVRATDDLGVGQVAFRAQTGRPQDAANKTIEPPSTDRTESFAFNVPLDAAPGAIIEIAASASDTKGHITQAAPVHVTVIDAAVPSVAITSPASGAKVNPGQQISVLLSAEDAGAVKSLSFAAAGLVSQNTTRTIDPAQTAVVTSFPITVPANARPGQTLTFDATATDKAGNTANAARVIVSVGDTIAPVVRLQTESGSREMVRGGTINVVAEADDEIAVSRIELTGQGAFTVSDAAAISPPSGSARTTFTIQIPATLEPGALLTLQARAVDISGNASAPATLTLSVKSLVDVTLPASAILIAGETKQATVQLADAAPAGGLRVDFVSANPTVVGVTSFVVFAPGESSRTIDLTAVSGGTVAVNALIQGAQRASMTVTVRGGVVTGVVIDSQTNPVPDVQVTVAGSVAAVTDSDGRYFVEGVSGPDVSVKALDPISRRIGFASGSMNRTNGFMELNVVLIAAGRIAGTVVHADGQTRAGPGVRVDLFASNDPSGFTSLRTTFTDQNSQYEFPLVTPGSYFVQAEDTHANKGRSSVTISTTGQEVAAPIGFLGRGTVTGTVHDGSGSPVPNAIVSLHARSVFGSAPMVTINAELDGTFTFEDVFIGDFTVTARDVATDRAGTADNAVRANGESVTQNVSLATYGNLQGTVVQADGVTSVAGARVTLNGTISVLTDEQGRYSFSFVRLGAFSLSVKHDATRGVGSASGSLTVHGATVTRDVALLAQGTIIATVNDANGQPVTGAFVNVEAVNGATRDFISGQTANDGTSVVAVVSHVLAGNFTARASSSGLQGSLTGTLAANEIKHITIQLEATASITGTVFAPDGQTPATTGKVAVGRLNFNGVFIPIAVTPLSDGAYRFDGLTLTPESPLGSGQFPSAYHLRAYDGQDRMRAIGKPTVPLTANGQVVTRDMSFVGLGNVNGRVLNPDGSSAGGFSVQVRDLNPDFGGFFGAQTNAAGFYEIADLAVGRLAVTTGDASQGLLGEGFGELTTHGQTVTIDVLLQSNAVNLPVNRWDGNGMFFDVQQDGSTRSGTAAVFFGPTGTNAFLMDLVAGGSANRFTGGAIGTVEDAGREVATRQSLVGLNVTRKVFVPQDGYFARYLEVFSNPTAAPITFDLRVTSNIREGSVFPGFPQITATSSGDLALSVTGQNPDRWVTLDDADNDPFLLGSNPSLAFVFDGTGAPDRLDATTLTETRNCNFFFCSQFTRHLTYQWTGITVMPGQTVAYLHFLVQQTSRVGSRTAAERLAQLPPEALEGLSADELGLVRNFALPADGISPIEPLPSLLGTVAGRTLEGNATTVVPFAQVRLKSQHPLFGRTYFGNSNEIGQFTFAGHTSEFGQGPVVPLHTFTLSATHPTTQVLAPVVAGSFVQGQTTADQNVVFNTGLLSGRVRRHTGDIVTGGFVRIFGGGGGVSVDVNTQIAGDGSYELAGVPPGSFLATASVQHPQGSQLTGTTDLFAVAAGQQNTSNIAIQPTGEVSGLVTNAGAAPASDVFVHLMNGNFSVNRSTRTDTSGRYTLTDVPVGTATIEAFEPRTSVRSSATIAVVQDQTATGDLSLIGVGALAVQVNFANGAPAFNADVRIGEAARGDINSFRFVGRTDVNGRFTIQDVTVGAFKVQARHPLQSQLLTEVPGTLTSHGETLPLTVTLPATGVVSGRITFAGGEPAKAYVELQENGQFFASTTADATGAYSFAIVPVGRAFTVEAHSPVDFIFFRESAPVTLNTHAETRTVDLTLIGFATLRVTALTSDNTPFAGARIDIDDAYRSNRFVGTTDANGVLLIPNVPEGLFRVEATDPSTFRLIGRANGTIALADHGHTVDIAIAAGVSLPTTLVDANGFQFDIQPSGRINNGSNSAYSAAYNLQPTVNGASGFFNGNSLGTLEDNRREVGIVEGSPSNVGGLDVTRKIFVPSDGYFARYLEVFRNPGTTPVTLDVEVYSFLGSFFETRVVTSSNGDNVADTNDRWLVTDDDDGTQPFPSSRPTLAHVVGGTGATADASVSLSDYTLRYRWNGLTLQPGQTVMLMHFAVQQFSHESAQASAERLAQLPPEAIAGLSADERAAILNFAVPADGTSPVPPLPPLNGSVTGQVLGGDNQTPVPSATVRLATNHPIFKGGRTAVSNAAGQFTVANILAGAFTLEATHPQTGVKSPVTTGSFGAGATQATQDVAFTNTGVIAGTVRRGGTAVTNGNANLFGTMVGGFNVNIAANGTYAFTGLPEGAYMVRINSGTGSGAAENVIVVNGQRTTVDIAVGTGTVTGTVTFRNGLPAPNTQVFLRGAVGGSYEHLGFGETDLSGHYTIPGIQLGRIFWADVSHPTNPFATTQIANNSIATDGQILSLNVTLRASATVRAKVVQPDGVTPIAGAAVYLERPNDFARFSGSTGAGGTVDIVNVAEGSFIVQANDGIGTIGPITGNVVAADDAQIVNVTLVGTLAGHVTGNLFAADGETPLYNFGDEGSPVVEAVDTASREVLSTTYPYSGSYFIFGITPGPQGFTIRARPSEVSTAVQERTGTFTQRGETVTMDFTMPVSVVKGLISFSDGTPVPYPSVFISQTDANGDTRTFYQACCSDDQGSDGRYTIPNVGVGPFTLTAQDSNTGLTATVTGTINSATDVVLLDASLPPSATVQGTVFNAAGTRVPFATVAVQAPGLSFTPSIGADDQGVFEFTRIPTGPIALQACDFSVGYENALCGSRVVTLPSGGATVDVTLPATGIVGGQVRQPDGVTPVPNANVIVENAEHAGPLRGPFRAYTTADGSGTYQAEGVPVGTVRVSGFDPNTNLGGITDGTLTAGSPATIHVILGNAVRMDGNYVVAGADGFRYDIRCDGRLSDGGTEDGRLSDAFDTAYTLNVFPPSGSGDSEGGYSFSCMSTGLLEENGRELVLGSDDYATPPLRVTRKIFVPEAGGFARYLEILSNNTPAAVSALVKIEGNLGTSDSNTRVVVAPVDTDDTFAVTDDTFVDDDESNRPALAHVFAGSNAPNGVAQTFFETGNDEFSYTWNVIVPPGETRILMHFAVQREPADAAGAETEALSLANLSDPNALAGMTSDEKHAIVNFVIP